MRLSKEIMSERVNYLRKIIEEKNGVLENAPGGKLYVSSGNGYKQFLIKNGEHVAKYLSKTEMPLIKAIA
ncbi:MAG: hypothetical protein IKX81_06140, partial [Firmicutes bacterium]|nr:hypothetical protein [Bacillota bacterium]